MEEISGTIPTTVPPALTGWYLPTGCLTPTTMRYKKYINTSSLKRRERGKSKLTNGYAFSDLDEFDYSYEWICNGKAVSSRRPPVVRREFCWRYPSRPDKCGELCLNCICHVEGIHDVGREGFKVAKEQLTYHDYEFPQLKDDGGKATFKETPEAVEIIAADALFTIEKVPVLW